MQRFRLRRRRLDDRGTVALEFALVIPTLLLLVYGGLSFGLAMAAKSVTTEAAAEGARAAIGAPIIAADGGSQCAAYTRTARAQALQALNGLGTSSSYATVTPTVGMLAGGACVDTATTGVIVTVTVSYPYAAHPTIPNAPGMGLVLPTSIDATYAVEVS
ncbi:MAG TPA: TadE family protein [Actinomycetota bacterium]|nr:TadE family protein [Actinomycetota bacterium]